MKALVKSIIQLVGILLLIIFTSNNASAEPIEPALSKDAVEKLIAQINKSEANQNLVKNLISIAQYYLYRNETECEKYINQSLSLSEKISYEEGLVKSLCLQATFLHFIANDYQLANKVIDRAISLSIKKEIPEMKAFAYYTKGLIYSSSNNLDASKQNYLIARNIYKSLGNKIKEAYIVKCLGDIHYYQNKPTQSLKNLLEAIEIYKNVNYQNLHYTYDLIGAVHKSVGNYEEALKYSLLTIESAKKTKDTADITLFYVRVGNIFTELNQPNEAFQYFSEALKKAEKDEGLFKNLRISASSISNILIQKGKPNEALGFYKKAIAIHPVKKGSIKYCADHRTLGDIYFSMKEFDKAEYHYLQMLKLEGNHSIIDYFNFISFIKLGNFYFSQGNFKQAMAYINKAKTINSIKSRVDIATLHFQQFKLDSVSGNYLSAIKHYQIYKTLNDSIFNEKKSNQIATINIQHETGKKQQKIETLTSENREQNAVLEKRIFERNVFTMGTILFLLLLLLSINRYQIKQKANKQLKEQQDILNKNIEELNILLKEKEELLQTKDKLIVEKEWLVKEVHHRVKNNLQMISTLLYSQATYLKDKTVIAAINDSQQRIHAISLIHQKLYQSDSLLFVNMKSYIHELVDFLKETFDTAQGIEFKLDVDSLEIEIIKAIPLGLILNEAITNSMKYAFTKDKKKLISIHLKFKEDDDILLVIKDNGKGLPTDFNPLHSDSLGINLVQGLSNQINADFSIKSENGTIISLEFKR